MSDREVQRFFVPTQPTLIGTYRAFRTALEKVCAAQGQKLDPAWYADGPEDAPELYKDQPHLLRKGNTDDIGPT